MTGTQGGEESTVGRVGTAAVQAFPMSQMQSHCGTLREVIHFKRITLAAGMISEYFLLVKIIY